MSESLKNGAISGAKWNTFFSFSQYFFTFILSIILASLLEPAEFGLVGMLSIFIAIAQVFIDSGLSTAIIRNKNTTTEDYSTVFWFNISVSTLFYLLLFFSAPLIAKFYKEPQLIILTRLTCLVFVINSFGIVQNAIFVKNFKFKIQSFCNLSGLIVSIFVGIVMAYKGYGVYSIVGQILSQAILKNLMLWLLSEWKPEFAFYKNSFKKLWKFGSNILLVQLITSVIDNFDNMLIAKVFSTSKLGYFMRAKSTKQIPEQIFSGVINVITFTVLSKINDQLEEFRRLHLKFFNLTVYGVVPIAFGIVATAHPLIVILYTEKWLISVPYLQIIGFAIIPYLLSFVFSQTIMAYGDSKLYLKLNTIKKILGLFSIPFGIFFNIKAFLIVTVLISNLGLILDIYFTSRLLNHKLNLYIKKMLLPIFIGSIMLITSLISFKIPVQSLFLKLVFQIITGILVYISLSIVFKIQEFYIYLNIAKEQYNNFINRFKKHK